MKKFAVQDRETGTFLCWAESVEEGKRLIEEFDQQDMDEGTYTPDFYECVETEQYPHLLRLREEWDESTK